MMSLEKVRRGLEYCKSEATMCGRDCPYYSEDFCLETLMGDSLELIKEQEKLYRKLLKRTGGYKMNGRQAARKAAEKIDELERTITHNVVDIRLYNHCIVDMINHNSPCKYCNDYDECQKEGKDVSIGCEDWVLRVYAITEDDVRSVGDDSKGIHATGSES